MTLKIASEICITGDLASFVDSNPAAEGASESSQVLQRSSRIQERTVLKSVWKVRGSSHLPCVINSVCVAGVAPQCAQVGDEVASFCEARQERYSGEQEHRPWQRTLSRRHRQQLTARHVELQILS